MPREESTDRVHRFAASLIAVVVLTPLLSVVFLGVAYGAIEAGVAHPSIWDVEQVVVVALVVALLMSTIPAGEVDSVHDQ